MPHHKRQVDPAQGPLAVLAHALRQLREAAGLTYDQMALVGNFCKSAFAKAATGKRLPTLDVVTAFVRVCEGDIDEIRHLWTVADVELHEYRHRSWPDPSTATTVGEYVERLDALRRGTGVTYRRIEQLSDQYGYRLPHSTVQDMLRPSRSGEYRLPNPDRLMAFLHACGLNHHEALAWTQARDALATGTRPVPELRRTRQTQPRGPMQARHAGPPGRAGASTPPVRSTHARERTIRVRI
jgi:hypothetical protein